jgi:hypothetical protein
VLVPFNGSQRRLLSLSLARGGEEVAANIRGVGLTAILVAVFSPCGLAAILFPLSRYAIYSDLDQGRTTWGAR